MNMNSSLKKKRLDRKMDMIKGKGKTKIWKRISVILVILLILYFILVNFLVTAALVPSFMRKFSFFNSITELCLDQQVHSEEIEKNLANGKNSYEKWLKETEFIKENVETEDGYTLVGTRIEPKNQGSHRWVLVLHGYTGWKEAMYPYARMYLRRGYHCIIPDLRTQGESQGDYIGMGWTDHYDCQLWIDKIISMDPQAQIVLHGQSMGASTALLMSGEKDLSDHVVAVVSEAAYTDAYTMFGDKLKEWFHLPAFPIVDTAVLCLKLRPGGYDLRDAAPIKAVKRSKTPTLFIHGAQDAMISVDMSYRLYDAASCEKEILIIDGAGHAQCRHKAPAEFDQTVFDFLRPYVN